MEILSKYLLPELSWEIITYLMNISEINDLCILIRDNCIFLWEEKPFVFMIKNKLIAESFKTYFNLLWKIAK